MPNTCVASFVTHPRGPVTVDASILHMILAIFFQHLPVSGSLSVLDAELDIACPEAKHSYVNLESSFHWYRLVLILSFLVSCQLPMNSRMPPYAQNA